jgi:ferredoxin
MGVEVKQSWPERPVVHCRATYAERLQRGTYLGEQSCTAANLVSGVQGCVYGCLGFGDCVRACNYDAIHVVNGLARVDYEKCVGCGACARVCPRNIITMVPFKADRVLVVGCSNRDFGLDVKAVCKIGCIGCKACERFNKDLFKVVDNLPRIDYERYDPAQDLQVILDKCPMKGLIYVGKPTPRDLAAAAGKKLAEPVQADFKTTADQTEWRG